MTKPYEHYNDQFRVSFELNKGIAGEMKESVQGRDRHVSIPKLQKFTDANLEELQGKMRKLGLKEQAARLDQSKRHVATLTGAYDAKKGGYVQSIYRLATMQNPKQAWPGLAVVAALHGMVPFRFRNLREG